jgi:thiosulfate dehydrogenase [quinone] large subunit
MRRLTSAECLAVIRIGLGLYFLSFAYQKLAGNYLASGAGLGRQLQQGLEGSQGFYQPFLSGLVIPNADTFSRLVTLGELCVAVSMILGLLTRAGGIVGILLNLNYMLNKGLLSGGGSVDRFFVLIELMMIVGAAGLVWGLDGAWSGWFARIPVVSWLAGVEREAPATQPVQPGYATNY